MRNKRVKALMKVDKGTENLVKLKNRSRKPIQSISTKRGKTLVTHIVLPTKWVKHSATQTAPFHQNG